MIEQINYWLEHAPFPREWILSALVLLGVPILRSLWLRLHFGKNQEFEIDDKRRAIVLSRNFGLLIYLIGLSLIWATELQAFALSMVAIAAAIVVATKELIMCLLGSLLRTITRQYSIGDYIEINHIRGKVIDINGLNTLIMQIGTNPLVGHMSGNTVSFPNSLLLSNSLQKDNILGNFVVHSFEIPVPIHLDSDVIVSRLYLILNDKCRPFSAEIAKYLEELQQKTLFATPAAQPRISRVPFNDTLYNLVIRFASPVARRLEIQQAVLDEFIRLQYKLLNKIDLQ